MSLTTTHRRLALAAAAVLGALTALSLLWGGMMPEKHTPAQTTVLTVAVLVATAMPLAGALLPARLLHHPASAALPALGFFGFGALLTGDLDVVPVRLLVILGVVVTGLTVLALLFAGQEDGAAERSPSRRF